MVLMREDDAVEETHEGAFWAKGPVQLTADEWWMTRLCELRNKIVHGDPIPGALWRHNGHHQIDHVHDRLIRALRAFVANHAEVRGRRQSHTAPDAERRCLPPLSSASFHSGQPPSRRRACRPVAWSWRTASLANAHKGPRQ